MARGDTLVRVMDGMRSKWHVSPQPALELYRAGAPPVPGTQVATAFGLLAHYTTSDGLGRIFRAGTIGGLHGCWLTPTAYAACMCPYNLGIDSPRDFCLLVDVSEVKRLWGPGTAGPSGSFGSSWRGGALEFFSPDPVPVSLVKRVCRLAPCGDRHR